MNMSSQDIEFSREVRGWAKFFQNGENTKKLDAFSTSLNNLNREMKDFNENASKSNKFLGKIAKLQESLEAQTRSANKVTIAVILLAIIQVIIAALQYFK